MKKKVIGHMVAPKEDTRSRFRRMDVLPRFVCLLLALLIWLLIANLDQLQKEDSAIDSAVTDVAT